MSDDTTAQIVDQPIEQLQGSIQPVPGRCGSKLRNSVRKYGHPRYCIAHPNKGKTRCYRHGGKAVSGIASGTFKHGGYSRFMPRELMADYERIRNDPHLLSLKNEVAWLRQQHEQIMRERAEHTHAGAALVKAAEAAAKTWQRVEGCRNATPDRLAHAMTAHAQAVAGLNEALHPATRAMDLRAEEREAAKILARVMKTEVDDTAKAHGMLALEVVLADRHALIALLKDAVEKHVPDREVVQTVLRAVAAGYAATAGRRDPAALTT